MFFGANTPQGANAPRSNETRETLKTSYDNTLDLVRSETQKRRELLTSSMESKRERLFVDDEVYGQAKGRQAVLDRYQPVRGTVGSTAIAGNPYSYDISPVLNAVLNFTAQLGESKINKERAEITGKVEDMDRKREELRVAESNYETNLLQNDAGFIDSSIKLATEFMKNENTLSLVEARGAEDRATYQFNRSIDDRARATATKQNKEEAKDESPVDRFDPRAPDRRAAEVDGKSFMSSLTRDRQTLLEFQANNPNSFDRSGGAQRLEDIEAQFTEVNDVREILRASGAPVSTETAAGYYSQTSKMIEDRQPMLRTRFTAEARDMTNNPIFKEGSPDEQFRERAAIIRHFVDRGMTWRSAIEFIDRHISQQNQQPVSLTDLYNQSE